MSVGQTAINIVDLYTNEAIASFLDTNDISLNFLSYSSFLIKFNANVNIYGASLLNQELIKNAYIIFPPLQEQKTIGEFLDRKYGEIDELLNIQNKMIEEFKDYKKSIIYEYVTGKKQVKINKI